MNQLKIIEASVSTDQNSSIYIEEGSYGVPSLAYNSEGDEKILKGNGSPLNRLLTCSELRDILSKNFIKGTKFIASTYNPVLYYLFPGSYDSQFNVDDEFIPTLSIPSLVRNEVDGFSLSDSVTQNSVRSIKACDSWYDNPDLANDITEELDAKIEEIFGCYKDFTQLDIEKEVEKKVGRYSVDITLDSRVLSLLSPTDYTDTINLEDWIYSSGKCGDISGKLDISYMYSIGEKIYGGSKTIRAFQYQDSIEDNPTLLISDVLIDEGKVQIEYVNKILKIYPKSLDVNEVSFTDCVLTIGKL